MVETTRRRMPIWGPAATAVGSVLFLLAPWAGSGQVDRSSVEVLSSASALAVWDGADETLALAAWFLLPLSAAGSVLAAGWHRRVFSAVCVLPIGPLMACAWLAVVRSPFEARWGAAVGTLTGLTATVLAGLVIMNERMRREQRT